MAQHRFLLLDRSKPRLPARRPDRTGIVVEYTAEFVVAENDYHSRGVIAIKICEDPWFHISRDEVREAVGAWLGVPRCDLEVEYFPAKGFHVLLPTPAIRDRVLSLNTGLTIGQAKLQLLPWTSMASTELVKLPFKVCLCIEGIPSHTRQAPVIHQLLPKDAQFECIDYTYRDDNEVNCCCVIVWSQNPDNIPKEVTLQLEELQDRSPVTWHFAEPAASDFGRPREGPDVWCRL
jgi:hypothetical protein